MFWKNKTKSFYIRKTVTLQPAEGDNICFLITIITILLPYLLHKLFLSFLSSSRILFYQQLKL